MYKNGFGINNLQWLMYHKTKLNQINIFTPIELLVDVFDFHVSSLLFLLFDWFIKKNFLNT